MSNQTPNPPTVQESQVAKTWLFSQNPDGSLSPAALGGGGNVNLTGINGIAPALTYPLPVELSDGTNPFGTPGNPLSVNVISGGGANASVGVTGVLAPTSATEVGWIDGTGKLQGVSVANPLPVSVTAIVADNVNQGNKGSIAQSWYTQLTDGTATVLGVSANPLYVQFASAQAVNATLSAETTKVIGVVRTADGSGNLLTSTGNALDVNIKSGLSNPLPVSATQTTSPWVVAGGKTNNNAAPGATNAGVLPAVANAASPVYAEGNQVAGSTDLSGNVRVVPFPGFPSIIQKNSGASTGSVASLGIAYSSNVSFGTTLIVVCGVGNGTTPTISDTIGNAWTTDVVKANGTAFNVAIFRAINKAAGANTITINNGGTGASIAGEIYEVAGLLTLSTYIFDQSAVGSGNNAAPSAANYLIPLYTNEYAFAAFGVGTGAQTITVTPGVVSFVNDSGQLNPTTPAGLFSFASASALCINVYNTSVLAAASLGGSEPWAVAVALYKPQVQVPATTIVRMGVANPTNNGGIIDLPNVTTAIRTSLVGAAWNEPNLSNPTYNVSNGGGNCVPVFAPVLATSTPGSGGQGFMQRTPAIYRGAQFSGAGQNTVWQPQAGKKVRLMKYKIEAGEDCTISGGPLPVNLGFWYNIGLANGQLVSILNDGALGFAHRFVVSSSVLSTSGNLYDSGWIDLGNGILAPVASQPLQMGIVVPQTTAAINPTWTIASNQWEAVTVGFKTTGGRGNFSLVQTTVLNTPAGAATSVLPTLATTTGNTIILVIRTSNAAAGVPTISVADTALNSYTVTALTTNASDDTNGSSLCIAYATNIVANASNVVTVTFASHTPIGQSVSYFEYSGMGTGGIDAALVGATGNSTAPASGNYTPATAGDLIISAYATAVNVTPTSATIPVNFRNVFNTFAAAHQGSVSVVDNFGNGALLAGAINVIAIGTEE